VAPEHLLVGLPEVFREERIDNGVHRGIAVGQAVGRDPEEEGGRGQREGAKLNPQVDDVVRKPGYAKHHHHHQDRLCRLEERGRRKRKGGGERGRGEGKGGEGYKGGRRGEKEEKMGRGKEEEEERQRKERTKEEEEGEREKKYIHYNSKSIQRFYLRENTP
jgi:hypothetical protein